MVGKGMDDDDEAGLDEKSTHSARPKDLAR